MVLGKKVANFDWEWGPNQMRPLEKGRKSPVLSHHRNYKNTDNPETPREKENGKENILFLSYLGQIFFIS